MKSDMQTVWLSTTVIDVGLGNTVVSQNDYGMGFGGVLVIAYKCWNGRKEFLEAWSYKHD